MSLVEVTLEGAVATVTLARPEARNALSVALCEDVSNAVTDISAHDARVIVLAGKGPVFCSGADFAAVSGPGALEFLPAFETMLETVARCSVPVVAKVHGAALGVGLQLANACDFRICEEGTKLGIPSSRLGIVINFENVQRLVLLAGIPLAKEILMTARIFTGTEAADARLVTRSVPSDSLDEAVDQLARGIAQLAPLSVQGAKTEIDAVAAQFLGAAPDDLLARMTELVSEAYHSADLAEGMAAMVEKRDPRFEGE